MPAQIFDLTEEQQDALEHLASLPKPIQTLGGYAGTGKTTLIKHLLQALPRFAVIAFTGKAAHVLRRKGLTKASTIHSCIYKCEIEEYYDKKGKRYERIVYRLRERSAVQALHRGFIVDEASMVSREIYNDLKSFDLPIIFVGDHGQLEPVGDKFNLMTNPDITLETIHRNAGEIAYFANFIREGNTPVKWRRHKKYSGKRVMFRPFGQAFRYVETIKKYDQIICAFNKTRVLLNDGIRVDLGYPSDRPVEGDRVMCLQNYAKAGLFNGMQGEIVAVAGDEMEFLAEGNTRRVRFLPEQLNNEKRLERDKTGAMPFDYCYAITCHKSQGDEFDHVLVWEQKCPFWSHERWAYTAASRARKKLTWVAA